MSKSEKLQSRTHVKRCFPLTPFRTAILAIISILAMTPRAMAQPTGSPPVDYRIHLQSRTFDPLTYRRSQAVASGPAYYIVQLQRTPTEKERQALQQSYRLELTEYVPNFAYVENLSPATLRQLIADPLYRAHVLFEPELKLSPKIGQRRFKTEERRAIAGLWLEVVLFRGADPQLVAQAAREKGRDVKIVDQRQYGGAAKITVIVPSMAEARVLAALPQVRWIDEVPEVNLDNGNTAGLIQSGTVGTTPFWNLGLHGEGQIIHVSDTVVDMNHCAFEDNGDNTIRFDHRKMVGFRNSAGSAVDAHGTFVAGIAAGNDFNNPGTGGSRGMAWAARMTFSRIETVDDAVFALSNWNAGRADGATIHTNSWHIDDMSYTQLSVDTDTFLYNNEDCFLAGSAGNTGVGETIGPPGTAKNALNVSASNAGVFGDGNSGPTTDNRRKPEIFAPGCAVTSSAVGTPCNFTLDATVFGAAPPVCATSWATPAVAGTAALVSQYYTEGFYPTGTRQPHNAFVPTGALLKATLLNGTLDMASIAGYGGNQEGFGLLQLNNVLQLPGSARNLRVWDTPNGSGFFSGAPARTHIVNVASAAQPLRVSLVWTDPPAAVGANPALVNNLNLTVTSPDGTQVFAGNDFNAAGLSQPGAANVDTLNNVEMAVINNPAVGNWTITVTPAGLNVGTQGYALVASADMPEVPAPAGNQNTLVVRAKFSGIVTEPSLPNLETKMINVADYIDAISYGQTTILPEFRGPVDLDEGTIHYYHPSRNLLIEMTTEVVQKLVAADANVFTKGTADPADDIDRMIIVTNDEDFNDDWATTGAWPYELPGGFTRPISVSIQGAENNDARFAHGLAHQFGLVDLYNHPGVTFPRAYADEWDIMAKPFRDTHPLVWSKERAGWLATHGDTVEYIARPAVSSPLDMTRQVTAQETGATNRKALAIGLTPNRATLAAEDQFYFVEVRDAAADHESDLPSSGVLIYLVNELVPQGQGPVILRDRTPGGSLQPFQAGDSVPIPGTGITIDVVSGTGAGPYEIRVRYAPPATDFNLRITRGDTINGQFFNWFSPDVWLDSPLNGENLAAGPPPNDAVERPMPGVVNKIRVRIFNDGAAPALNFDVRARISQPYHTIGDQADFNTVVGIQHVDGLVPAGQPVPPGQLPSGTILTFDWTPLDTGEAHSCVWVDFPNVSGTDTNEHDNAAQENLEKVTSVTGSPYHPVDFNFHIENPYDDPSLFYFRVDGAPPGWSIVKTPEKALLSTGQRIDGTITITPPPDEKICSSRILEVTAWTPRGDTLIPVGGSVVQVDMRRPTELTLEVSEERCHGGDFELINDSFASQQRCRRIVAQGCTIPPLPNQLIWVRYTSPSGDPVWHQVMTDANGCFEDFIATGDSSVWNVTAGYEGNDCQGPDEEGPRPSSQGFPGFPGGRDLWYSFHLGHNFPVGDFKDSYASGPSLTLDFERSISDRFSLYAMFGYHYFDAKAPGADETYLTNLSLNVRLYAAAGAWRQFIGIGPGFYQFEGGGNDWGANLSAGLEFPIGPKLRLETGADLHAIDAEDLLLFLDMKLGVKWTF